MRRRLHAAALAAAWALLLGVAGTPVEAHSQLVSSSPGAASLLDAAPEELRLVFSEPPEARYTGVSLSDRYGIAMTIPGGARDPADPHAWVVRLATPLPDGVYTVDWRAMSAADGHVTTGFFTFGVGMAIAPREAGSGSGPGQLDAVHDVGPAIVEVLGRALGYVGFMLAFGLFVFGFVVLRPASPPSGGTRRSAPAAGDPWRVLVATQAAALVVGSVGGGLLALVAAGEPDADLVAYLAGTRTGWLIVARLGVALAGAAAVFALLRAGRPGSATAVGGLAGFVALVLLALGGHASAFASPAPLAVMIVHLGAVSVWLAGVAGLAWLAVTGERRDLLRATVPRFSALALVSVALIALTGAAAAWAETREVLPFGTPYGLALAAKAALFAAALGFGAANFLDGGRGRPTFNLLRGRLLAEAALAATVLLAAGNLASGSPPGPERAVQIAPAASTVAPTLEIGLDFRPGRPGPNRFEVVLPGGLADERTVALLLQRLDENVGQSRIDLRRVVAADAGSSPGAHFVADGGLLLADSRWEATAIVVEPDGTEVTRQRFTYAVDQQAIAQGRLAAALDPALAIALALLVMALLAVSFAVGGGKLPRAERAASRVALLVGGTAAGVLALALLIAGVET